jgi:nitrate reductase delta subunit
MNAALYESLARLLEYPTADFAVHVDTCRSALSGSADFAAFARATETMPLSALEELYIQTFDFNPNTTLDIGWQLFAEDYNRGLFLAKLRTESRRLNVPETHELPDHLPHVLRLLARMEPAEAADFIVTCVLPGITKTRDALEETNPYRRLIQCVFTLLETVAGPQVEVALT